MTEARKYRMVTCCPSCKSAAIHFCKKTHMYKCDKCSCLFPKQATGYKEVVITNTVPAGLRDAIEKRKEKQRLRL